MAQKGRKRNEAGGLLDPSTFKELYSILDAQRVMFNTSPASLEDLTGINKTVWATHRNNWIAGKMSMDKSIELLQICGFKIIQEMGFYR